MEFVQLSHSSKYTTHWTTQLLGLDSREEAGHFISNVQADTKTHTASHQIDAINISVDLGVLGAQLLVSKFRPIEFRAPVLHLQPKKKSKPFSESSLFKNIKKLCKVQRK